MSSTTGTWAEQDVERVGVKRLQERELVVGIGHTDGPYGIGAVGAEHGAGRVVSLQPDNGLSALEGFGGRILRPQVLAWSSPGAVRWRHEARVVRPVP
jgi:hypothetical protein